MAASDPSNQSMIVTMPRASNRSLYPDRRTGFKSSFRADFAMRGSAISFVTRKSNALSDSFLVLFFFMEKRSNTGLLSGHLFKEITCTIPAFPSVPNSTPGKRLTKQNHAEGVAWRDLSPFCLGPPQNKETVKTCFRPSLP